MQLNLPARLFRRSVACIVIPAAAVAGGAATPVRLAEPAVALRAALAQATAPGTEAPAAATHSCSLPLGGRSADGGARIAYESPSSAAELAANIECILSGSVRTGRWGILAVSLSRGDTLFARDEGEQFQPASTMKLLTSALAFDQLGEGYRFNTTVLRMGELDTLGVLRGNLILQGGGDPAFSTHLVSGDSATPVELLAEQVRIAGITRVAGDLIADPSAFEPRLVPDGWLDRYLDAAYAARVSALSLNGNVANVVVVPGEGGDEAAPAVLDPPATTMEVQSAVRTVPGGGSRIAVRKIGVLTFEARGWIGERSEPQRFSMVVEDPASFTAGAFRSALELRGVAVSGRTILNRAPNAAEFVTTLPSPSLARLVTAMNRESINHYAELIFRNAGRGADGLMPGSAAAGFSRLSDFLANKVGTDPAAVFAADGSGLSVRNQVTPRALVQLLSHAHRAPWGAAFHSSLPVAGESATLRQRMRNTPAAGNLHAKTGTTRDVISLSGYVTAENGELLAFAFLYNGTDRDRARATIDKLGSVLADLIRVAE